MPAGNPLGDDHDADDLDVALVSRIRDGDREALETLVLRHQSWIYILGEIFGVTDIVGAELLETSRANFRQKLSRARRDLHSFMQEQCGLVNQANPCRCAKKTRAFMDAGYVNPANLLFANTHMTRVREMAPQANQDIDALDAAYAAIHRDHPFHASPDFVAALRGLLDRPAFRSILDNQ